MNWFNRKKRQRITIVPVPSTAMRADQWTASPECVTTAQKLFATPEFRTILSILRNESPSCYGLPMGSSHDDQIAHSYKAAGYNLCLNNLESLAVKHTTHAPLEATFEPEPPRQDPLHPTPEPLL